MRVMPEYRRQPDSNPTQPNHLDQESQFRCSSTPYNAEDRAHAEKAVAAFAKAYEANWLKAVEKITETSKS
jgi:hypothetical protein